MSSYCVLFSGQSAQQKGLCRGLWQLPGAREVLAKIIPGLGEDLVYLTTEMPDHELSLTFNAQRAIHAHHLGHWFAFRSRHPDIALSGVIGHSVGIVAALVAAEAMTPEDSALFVRERAEAFAQACARSPEPHGLVAVFAEGFEEEIDEIERFPGIRVALHNSIGKGILGGNLRDLEAFIKHAGREGWDIKFKSLAVQGAYHTSAFESCTGRLSVLLDKLPIRSPKYPVFMGTSGKAETDPLRIKRLLAEQPCSRERHLEAVRAAYAQGCRSFLEIAKNPQPLRWIHEQLEDPKLDCRSITTDQLG